jgi:Ca2+-binding EF-hand superfamily protein
MRHFSRRLALPLTAIAATLLAVSPALAQGGMGGMGGMGGGGMGGGMGGGPGGTDHGGPPMDDGGPRPPRDMKPISLKNFDAAVTGMFRAADANHDGMVTLAEFNQVVTARRDTVIHARFKAIDTNHNGQIDEGEFIAWQRAMGSTALSDNAATEYAEIIPDSIGPDLGDGERNDALSIAIELNAVVIAKANINYDAGMSLDELLAYEHARFDKADTDKDGTLSRDEIDAMMPRRGGPGGPNGGPAAVSAALRGVDRVLGTDMKKGALSPFFNLISPRAQLPEPPRALSAPRPLREPWQPWS